MKIIGDGIILTVVGLILYGILFYSNLYLIIKVIKLAWKRE